MKVNEAKEADLSAEILREILDYSPETGLFSRKVTVGSRGEIGRIVGSPHHGGYLYIWIGKYQYLVHRLAWLWMTGDWPDRQLDHINRDKSDNRWSNLRLATHGQNRQNSRAPKNNTSGYIGVSFVKATSKWHAYIRVNRQRVHLGFFGDRTTAAACRNINAAYMYGDFARLNQISDWIHD